MARTGGLTPAAPPGTLLRRRQLLGCLAAVALGHLALLGDWRRPMVAATNPPAGAAASAPSSPAVPARMTVVRPLPGMPRLAAAAPAPAPEPAPPVRQVDPPAPERPATAPGDEIEALDASLYLPRSALTEGASPIDLVDLPYPDQAPSGQFRAELTLFIDRDGSVRRVRIEDGALPAALEDAARQAFLRARFAPGSIDGVAVRTRMRIEIEFSAGPRPDAPHGAP